MSEVGHSDVADRSALKTFDLGPAEWLVLWGLRYWVACYRDGAASWPLISDVFKQNQAGDAALSLDALLQLTSVATTRVLDVRCPACPGISPDEVMIIDAVGCAQAGDKLGAFRILRDWLPAAAARMALEMVAGLARVFSDAGLVVPEKDRVLAVTDPSPASGGEGRVVSLH